MPTKHGNVLSWATDIDPNAITQAERTARLPFVVGHLALMADAHVGIGATIGSVIATRGAVIPSAVGVDIGCGMIAVEMNMSLDGLPDGLDKLHAWIASVVPAGVGKGHKNGALVEMTVGFPPTTILTDKQKATAVAQFGSLGSGNHFVEVCADERDRIWVVLHSGSRGIGNQLARQHIAVAKGLMKRWFVDLEDPDLAYLVEGTTEFDSYIADMLWAQLYAFESRHAMMDAIIQQLRGFVNPDYRTGVGDEVTRINCHHNFAQMEHHHNQNVWVTRKGAISARLGERGVIPGSMGTRSYIVTGLGNPASFDSSSHGAGRRMSRSAARKTLDVAGLEEAMAGKSWDHNNAAALIDEDPRAYKDIDLVMADQADLVRVDHTLSQILNYKGR